MKRIIIPEHSNVKLPFYLAIEEWVATNLDDSEYFFSWQSAPTVICGRHQEIPFEVDLDYAKNHGIDVCRRKSGGGAVYSDKSNVMFSYITPTSGVQTTFNNYISKVVDMLGSLGIKAESSGRNDISINGRKVAGNAFLRLKEKSIVHGTMLIDIDIETMHSVLTPSKAKLHSNGVKSVASRVTSLKEHGLKLSPSEFMDYAMNYLCNDSYTLTHNDIACINEILTSYYEPAFLNVKGIPGFHSPKNYITGVGQIGLKIVSDPIGLVKDAKFYGDFFSVNDIQNIVNTNLIGIPANEQSIVDKLKTMSLENYIVGYNPEEFKPQISII